MGSGSAERRSKEKNLNVKVKSSLYTEPIHPHRVRPESLDPAVLSQIVAGVGSPGVMLRSEANTDKRCGFVDAKLANSDPGSVQEILFPF